MSKSSGNAAVSLPVTIMSKLDNIILECINKVLDGKEEKLGDYVDPTKEQIKDLIRELFENREDMYDFENKVKAL
jgi:hypothetical protein